jgi:hypothetical protein
MGKDTLDFDTREFEKRLKLYTEKEQAAAIKALKQNRNHLVNQSMELAPKLEAHLEGDIKGNPLVKAVGDALEAEVHAGTGLSRNYAVRMHESLAPAMPTTEAQMQPGETTAGRPGTAVGPAGGKYLTRPLMHFMKKYTANIAKRIKAVK